jgi:hypothetical protein
MLKTGLWCAFLNVNVFDDKMNDANAVQVQISPGVMDFRF